MGGKGVSRVWRRQWTPVAGRFVEKFWNQAGDAGEAIVVKRIVVALRRAVVRDGTWNPTILVRFAPLDHERLGPDGEDVRARLESLISARAAQLGVRVGTPRVVIERAAPGRAEPFVIVADHVSVPPATRRLSGTDALPPATEDHSWTPHPRSGSVWSPVLALRHLTHGGRIPIPLAAIAIGRAVPAPGRLTDRRVGRRHCLVQARDDLALLCTDLRSTNGTWVDGNRVERQAVVRIGQVIRLGATDLVVEPW
jgi:hypothetical protein